MDELPQNAKRLLALARSADEPTDAARERVRHGVLLAVGAGGAAAAGAAASPASASATTAAKLGLASSASKAALICATIATVGTAAWVMRPTPAPAVRAHAHAARQDRAQEAPRAAAVQAPAEAPAAAARETSTAQAPATLAAEARAPEAVQAEPRTRPALASTRRSAAPERPVATQGLHDEMTLLAQASAALDRDDLTQARALLSSHRARFASGQLRQERRGLEVLTRCMANEAGARVAARAYLQSAPDAVLSARIASACKLESTP